MTYTQAMREAYALAHLRRQAAIPGMSVRPGHIANTYGLTKAQVIDLWRAENELAGGEGK